MPCYRHPEVIHPLLLVDQSEDWAAFRLGRGSDSRLKSGSGSKRRHAFGISVVPAIVPLPKNGMVSWYYCTVTRAPTIPKVLPLLELPTIDLSIGGQQTLALGQLGRLSVGVAGALTFCIHRTEDNDVSDDR